jgi:hypothetical protein
MKMRENLAGAKFRNEELEAKVEYCIREIREMPDADIEIYLEDLERFGYNDGVKDTIELFLPDIISWRKVRDWLKDWTLSCPLEDIEAVVEGGAKLE